MKSPIYFPSATKVEAVKIGEVNNGQDGAIWKDNIFRFESNGVCTVYSLKTFEKKATFTLDKKELIVPHCNAVFFCAEYFEEGDEYPLLYANVYNNYASEEDRRLGTCCVYRLVEKDGEFQTTLVQILKVGFTETPLWKFQGAGRARPYGNFIADVERKKLYVFLMNDEKNVTRIFELPMPAVKAGEWCERYGCNVVTLGEDEIISSFDGEYSHFIQGAAFYGDILYSTEGFTDDEQNRPAFRFFNVKEKTTAFFFPLRTIDMPIEPEFIDVYEGKTYYCDVLGSFYEIYFTD